MAQRRGRPHGARRLGPHRPAVSPARSVRRATPSAWPSRVIASYVTKGGSGIDVVDASDPTQLVQHLTFDTAGVARSLVHAGIHVYVADGRERPRRGRGRPRLGARRARERGLAGTGPLTGSRWMVTWPTWPPRATGCTWSTSRIRRRPQVLTSVDTPLFSFDLDVVGDVLYCADINALVMIDVSDPQTASIIGQFDDYGGESVRVAGEYAYLGAGGLGLSVIDVTDPGPRLSRDPTTRRPPCPTWTSRGTTCIWPRTRTIR